jgi:hypothetical protein
MEEDTIACSLPRGPRGPAGWAGAPVASVENETAKRRIRPDIEYRAFVCCR